MLAGDKLPAIASTRILYRDSIAIAAVIAGKFTPLIELEDAELAATRQALWRNPAPRNTNGKAEIFPL